MLEEFLEDQLVDALRCIIVFFTIIDFVIAEVLSDKVSESLERLEPDVS